MDSKIIEAEAQRLFGGARVEVKSYQDAVINAWDVSITPNIDHEKRFIRVDVRQGLPAITEYLKKIQQNLLKLQHNGAFGINPVQEKIDQKLVDEAVAGKLLPVEKSLEEQLESEPEKKVLNCDVCAYNTPYPGILSIHKKKHKAEMPSGFIGGAQAVQPIQSVAIAQNDPLIYDVRD